MLQRLTCQLRVRSVIAPINRGAIAMPARLVNPAMRTFTRTASPRQKQIEPIDPVKLLKKEVNYLKPEHSELTPLKQAHALYATIHIHDRKFLVTKGDIISLPVNLQDVQIGDKLNFDEVSVIGSRDYTLTGDPRIDTSVFKIQGTVLEKTRAKRTILEKTKRRRRHVKHIVVKPSVTVVRINELEVL